MAGAGLISRRIMSLITHLVVFYVENKYKTLKSYLCYRFVNLYRGVGTSVYLKSGPGRDPGRHGLQCQVCGLDKKFVARGRCRHRDRDGHRSSHAGSGDRDRDTARWQPQSCCSGRSTCDSLRAVVACRPPA